MCCFFFSVGWHGWGHLRENSAEWMCTQMVPVGGLKLGNGLRTANCRRKTRTYPHIISAVTWGRVRQLLHTRGPISVEPESVALHHGYETHLIRSPPFPSMCCPRMAQHIKMLMGKLLGHRSLLHYTNCIYARMAFNLGPGLYYRCPVLKTNPPQINSS